MSEPKLSILAKHEHTQALTLKASVKQQAKKDALELAQIIYEVYTKEKESVRVKDGQNNNNMS